MAGNAELADTLARTMIELYANLQAKLTADIARTLATGIDAPTWATEKLNAVGELRRRAEAMLTALEGPMREEAAKAILAAYTAGQTQAAAQVAAVPALAAAAQEALPQEGAISRLVTTLVTRVAGTHVPILRATVDAYRSVVARASVDTLAGVATRRRAAQVAWEGLLSEGVTGFVDKRGRSWELASYVEMATRSTVAQAAVQGHLDKLEAIGLDLVMPSDSPQECARCRPWEGKILTRSGPDGRRVVEVESVVDDRKVRVQVAGSVAEAILAGLMHPNCTHRFVAYLPGATKIPTATANPQGDKDRQRLRALERELRRRKLTAEAVIDPAASARLNARVKEQQAKIRDHVAATGLLRQRAREQVGTAR